MELNFSFKSLYINSFQVLIILLFYSINFWWNIHNSKYFGCSCFSLTKIWPELLSLSSSHSTKHHSENSCENVFWIIKFKNESVINIDRRINTIKVILLENSTHIVQNCKNSILNKLWKSKHKSNNVAFLSGNINWTL